MTHKLKMFNKDGRQTQEFWAFSTLSDAQEELAMGHTSRANQKINQAKMMLMGKFKYVEGGYAIELLPTKRKIDGVPQMGENRQ